MTVTVYELHKNGASIDGCLYSSKQGILDYFDRVLDSTLESLTGRDPDLINEVIHEADKSEGYFKVDHNGIKFTLEVIERHMKES